MAGGLSKNCADVKFQGGEEQETPLDEMLVVGGACPQPHLRTHDYVLCCVRMPHGHHKSTFGVCDLYIPAQVQVNNAFLYVKNYIVTVAGCSNRDHYVQSVFCHYFQWRSCRVVSQWFS